MNDKKSILEIAERLRINIETLKERMKVAKRLDTGGYDDTIHFAHLYCALRCDIDMIIEDLEKVPKVSDNNKTFDVKFDNLFKDNDWFSFHDCLSDVVPADYTEEECREVFEILPDHIQLLAVEWRLSDTVFRDDAYVFLKDNRKVWENIWTSKIKI
jgi:hypothetical protein